MAFFLEASLIKLAWNIAMIIIGLDADISDKDLLQVSQQVSQRDEFISEELTNHLFQVTF